MLKNIEVLCHSSIRFNKERIIYIDPFRIKKNYNDADIILITHSHYDHFSEEDIQKVRKENTIIMLTEDLNEKALNMGFEKEKIMIVKPNKKYKIDEIEIETIPAYNVNKQFHPKTNQWVGYIINLQEGRYYIAGDTDATPENRQIKCDVAFVPIGGTYTMTFQEAARLINEIKPKIAVPIHYGEIVGTKQDAKEFKKLLDTEIKCEILL